MCRIMHRFIQRMAPPALGVWGTSEEALSMDYGRLDTATKGHPSVHAADAAKYLKPPLHQMWSILHPGEPASRGGGNVFR